MSDNETPTVARGDRSEGARPAASPTVSPHRNWSPELIDLRGLDGLSAGSSERGAPRDSVRVRVARAASPLESMTDHARMRLFIRVLCELVAYGEVSEQGLAGDS